jgi:hypothetical protein
MTCSFSGVDSRDGFSFGALRIVSAGPALQIAGGDEVDLMAKRAGAKAIATRLSPN